jgi:hypothetical protein
MKLSGIVATIWNCLTTTEMPEKTEDNWMNVANYFCGRMHFPTCIGAVDEKHT